MAKTSDNESLFSALWNVEAESLWTAGDVEHQSGARLVFSRHVEQLLRKLMGHRDDIQCGYGAVTGLELDRFLPVAAVGMALDAIVHTKRHSSDTLVADIISTYDQKSSGVILVDEPNSRASYRGVTKAAHMALLPLVGHGELFGYVCFYSFSEKFTKSTIEVLENAQPIISRLLAESIFSLRVWEVAKVFSHDGDDLEKIYQKIVSSAARVFAATGAILRIYDGRNGTLNAVDFEAAPGADPVAQILLADDSVGEGVAREVFDDEVFGWTVGMLPQGEDADLTGTQITHLKEGELRQQGITAYCVFRLEATNVESGDTEKLGTLSIFHCSASRFSSRDIALAKSFVQQASNIVALRKGADILLEKTAKLEELNDEIETANQNLLVDSQLITRVEVVSLLAHDLGHKALGAQNAFDDYKDSVRKAIREHRSFDSLQRLTSSTESTLQDVTASLSNINNLFGREGAAEKTEFDLQLLGEEVFNTLSDAMGRNKCQPDNAIPQGIVLFGNRGVLLQALFNMVINSIDAQRTRRSQRTNTIRMIAQQTTSGKGSAPWVQIRVSDEGPGIDRARFPNPNNVFKLGESSKINGTGRGLSISRNLVSSYYGGSISLIDPDRALFQIDVPQRVT